MNDKNVKESVKNVTDLGGLFVKYKVPAIIIIVVLLLVPIGIGGYIHLKGQKEEGYAEKIFEFTQEELNLLKENKLKSSEFLEKLKALMAETKNFDANLPLLVEAADQLVEIESYEEAKELLELGQDTFAGLNEYANILIVTRLSALYDDMGQVDKSISLLEGMINSGSKILEGKNYLDLGRFYLKKGDKEKAKEKFLYVVNNFDEDNYKKLARLYLSRI